LSRTITRRRALRASGIVLAGFALPGRVAPAAPVAEVIRMRSRDMGAHVSFDPIGLLVQPGTTIRWIVEADVHTTTAYHPANDSHPLRIPADAQPWASDYLLNPGDSFEVTLTVEGVYDYYIIAHPMKWPEWLVGSSWGSRQAPARCLTTTSPVMHPKPSGPKLRRPLVDSSLPSSRSCPEHWSQQNNTQLQKCVVTSLLNRDTSPEMGMRQLVTG
jgi:plastocyanin